MTIEFPTPSEIKDAVLEILVDREGDAEAWRIASAALDYFGISEIIDDENFSIAEGMRIRLSMEGRVYRALKKLIDEGLVQEAGLRPVYYWAVQ
jgi:chromosome segregation and condensation protein ScpB